MLERIWSGWRSSYVQDAMQDAGQSAGQGAGRGAVQGDADGSERSDQPEPSGSVFTRLLESGEPDTATHIVHRGELVFAIANIHPYTSGHLLVVPFREVADLADLTADETTELWALVTEAVAVVRAAYAPDGMNVGLNLGRPAGGSVPTHLHVHVVPRWTGDSNFMSAIANTQTLPEALDATADRLRSAWAERDERTAHVGQTAQAGRAAPTSMGPTTERPEVGSSE